MSKNPGKMDEKPEINSTVSTKLSTDQLICKSPPSSVSTAGSNNEDKNKSATITDQTPIVLYLGVLQILFGLLMAVFGVLVLIHESNLSQIGGGLWGGCLAAFTGVIGVFSVAKDCCPLKSNFQRIAHTAFLALSLVSLAVAHLVLVIACIGLSRDANRNDFPQNDEITEEDGPATVNISTILTNTGLLIVSACECVAAAMSSYHVSRLLCPCFRRTSDEENGDRNQYMPPSANKEMLVSSWLGKQGQAPPMYAFVQGNAKGVPKMMTPVFTVPPPPSVLPPSLMGYPLIPAPLGTTPPPILHPSLPHSHRDRVHRKRKRYPNERQVQRSAPSTLQEDKTKKKKKEKKKQITTEEVAKTYTGLDRVIAEEFIEICDSSRQCTESSGCTSSGCTSSDSNSNEGTTRKK